MSVRDILHVSHGYSSGCEVQKEEIVSLLGSPLAGSRTELPSVDFPTWEVDASSACRVLNWSKRGFAQPGGVSVGMRSFAGAADTVSPRSGLHVVGLESVYSFDQTDIPAAVDMAADSLALDPSVDSHLDRGSYLVHPSRHELIEKILFEDVQIAAQDFGVA